MSENRTGNNGLGQAVVKSMATLARDIAKDSVNNRCFLLMHQPEEPKDLAKRLAAMDKK